MLKLTKHLLRNSLIRILLFQFVLISIISAFFAFFFSHEITQKYIEKHHQTEKTHLTELNKVFSENLKQSEEKVALLARILSSLKGDFTILQQSAPTQKGQIYEGEFINFIDLNGKCLSCSDDSLDNILSTEIDSTQWLHTKNFTGRVVRHPIYDLTVKDSLKEIGHLVAKISLSRLTPSFSTNSKLQYVLADNNAKLIYASPNTATYPLQDYIHEAFAQNTRSGFINDSIHSNHIYFIKEKTYSLLFLHPKDEAIDLKKILYLSNIAIVIIILICFISNALLIFFHLLHPIKKVNRKIQKISDQNWNGTITQKTKIKELSSLFNALNAQIQIIQQQRLEQNQHRVYLEKEVQKKIEELEKANHRLQEISRTDELTGLPNRRDIKDKISFEISRAKRFQSSFSLLLFDIDYFKKINDTYGHLAGDYVLKEFAAITQKLLRKYDYAARFGGEEFLIVLPETNETSAQIVAERFRRYIENQLFSYDNQIIKVTVSVGISVFDHSLGLDGSLLLADKALYYSKENGRNRVTLWTKDLE